MLNLRDHDNVAPHHSPLRVRCGLRQSLSAYLRDYCT